MVVSTISRIRTSAWIFRLVFLLLVATQILGCVNESKDNARIIWDKYENGNPRIIHQFLTDTARFDEDYLDQEFYENGQLKIEGLENQDRRKGEWDCFSKDGINVAKMNYVHGMLEGPIELFNDQGEVTVRAIAKDGVLSEDDIQVSRFVEQFSSNEQRPNWNDSLRAVVDMLNKQLED